jgi:hypothetical protein
MVMQEPIQVSSGDLVCELNVQISGIVDFGMTLDQVLSGTPLTSSGTRLDISWEGTIAGVIKGRVSGIDYLYVRPDGRMELHIHGVITTEDEARVSFSALGACMLNDNGTARLSEYMTMHTCFEQYTWVNQTALRAVGLVDLAAASISLQVYAA